MTHDQVCFKLEENDDEILIHLIEDDNNSNQEYFNFDDVNLKKESLNTPVVLKSETTEESTNKLKCKSKLIKKYLCNVCGGYFQLIRRHLESHGPYNCMDCLMNFTTEALYGHHLMTTHDNGGQRYSCDYCSLTFASFTTLATHQFTHTGRYSCPLCNFTVKGKSRHSLVNHIRRHEGKYTMKCEICGRGFMDKNMMTYHLEMHEAIPKYECEFCKKKFTVKRYLDVHKSYNHKKEMYGIEEVYQCEVCGRSFTFEKSLVRHLSCIHKIGKDRTRECPVCHKTIANNHNLKKHMRIHTGEKRFCCDTCGKAFSEKKYLDKHQNVHLKQRLRKSQAHQQTESDEDSPFSNYVNENMQNELTGQSVDYFIEKINVEGVESNKDVFYFTTE